MGPDAMILVFRMLSFKPTFSLSFFTFIKRLFSPSSLSAIRLVSFAYLRRSMAGHGATVGPRADAGDGPLANQHRGGRARGAVEGVDAAGDEHFVHEHLWRRFRSGAAD